MKRFLPIFCALFLFAGNHAAQASDSVTVKNLSYAFVNTNNLPVTITDSLISSTPLLKDLYRGHVAKGYAFTLTEDKLLGFSANTSLKTPFNAYIFLLDNQYNVIQSSYTANGSLLSYLKAGSYYLLFAYAYTGKPSTSNHYWYELTITAYSNTADFAHLTYKQLNVPDTLTDSLTTDEPLLTEERIGNYAKGYQFQGTKDQYISISLKANPLDEYLFLLDANHRILNRNDDDPYNDCRIVTKLPATGTYYAVVSSFSKFETGSYTLLVGELTEIPVYYIDALNGNDTASGQSVENALRSLDTALARTQGVGTFYLTEDYTFGTDYQTLFCTYANIYPYGKDIRLSFQSDFDEDVFEASNILRFGEANGNHFFLIDSARNTELDQIIDGDAGSLLEVSNLKVTNSTFGSILFEGDSVVFRNCTFSKDTLCQLYYGGHISLYNTDISGNTFNYFIEIEEWYTTPTFRMEGGKITSNTFAYDYFWLQGNIELISGQYKYNRYTGYSSLPFFPVNMGGIFVYNGTLTLGAAFTMDVNNYIFLEDTNAVIHVTENLRDNAAQIVPLDYDTKNLLGLGYANGRKILTGTDALLAANYQKFLIAQLDEKVWFLLPNGRLSDTEVKVKEAGKTLCSIYPNPTQGMARITLNQEVTELRITDMQGKVLHRQEVNGEEAALNLQSYANGMYFIQFRNGQQVIGLQKVIKQ